MSTLQTVQKFEELTAGPMDPMALMEATHISFQLVEPLMNARVEHPAVQGVFDTVKEEVVRYYKSIDQSVKTSQAGYGFADNAEQLCEYLLAPKGQYSTEDLQEFIQDMRHVARLAHQDAVAVRDMFRNNREKFAEITRHIPSIIAQLEREKAVHSQAVAAHGLRAKIFNGVAMSTAGGTAAILTGIGAAGLATCPPALIALPILWPVIAPIEGIFGASNSHEAIVRGSQAERCERAMQQLDSALNDLTAVGLQIDKLADYWTEMDTLLENIHHRVEEIQADRIVKLRIQALKNNWGQVKRSYLEYKIGIGRLQDYYPSAKHLE